MNSKPTTSGWQMAGYIYCGLLLGSLLGQVMILLGGSIVSEEREEFLFWFSTIYPVFWLGLAGFIASWSRGSWSRKIRSGLYWIGLWHFIVICFISGGAVIGSLLFVSIGSLAGMDYSAVEMLKYGARDGGFYLLIWSPGIAMVLCFMKAYKECEKDSA
jgi:hypothetical protein